MTRGSEEPREQRPIQIVRDEEEGWTLQDGPDGPITETLEQETELAQQGLNEPVVVDEDGQPAETVPSQEPDESQEPAPIPSEVAEEVGRKIITAIRDNLGEFAPLRGEDTVYIDEDGNVVSSGNLPTTTQRPRGQTTAIRDTKGEFNSNDETIVRINEDGEIVGQERDPQSRGSVTAIRDNKGEYARGGDYALAAPAGLFVIGNDLNRPRWRVEFEKVQRYAPQFSFKAKNGQITSVEGDLRIGGRRYGIRIVVPANFPYSMPKILARGWSTRGAPHIYGDGDLCVMSSSQWSSKYSIALLVKKSAIWVNKWLNWKQTGRWPLPSQH